MAADLAPKAMDVAARSIDLLTVLTKVAQDTGVGAGVMKEIGRWLGREGLDEHELQFFLESTKGLIRPNDQTEVATFFKAVTNRKSQPSVVPLWAQPSGVRINGLLILYSPFLKWVLAYSDATRPPYFARNFLD